MPVRPTSRRGFTLIEALIVIALLGLVTSQVVPGLRDLKERSALRSARASFVAAVTAAQEAALQKGKVATLRFSRNTLLVRAQSGLTGNQVTMLGPLPLDRQFGATVTAVSPATDSLRFDARGLITPATRQSSRYIIRIADRADTVCVSGGGLVLPKGCAL